MPEEYAVEYVADRIDTVATVFLGLTMGYARSENKHLPVFVVMVSLGASSDQRLYDRSWGSGLLSSRCQGVKFHNGPDPVLYLSNPGGLALKFAAVFSMIWRR